MADLPSAVGFPVWPPPGGALLEGNDEGTYVGDRTCLAPYDITLLHASLHASNEYGGTEVADSAYEKGAL